MNASRFLNLAAILSLDLESQFRKPRLRVPEADATINYPGSVTMVEAGRVAPTQGGGLGVSRVEGATSLLCIHRLHSAQVSPNWHLLVAAASPGAPPVSPGGCRHGVEVLRAGNPLQGAQNVAPRAPPAR